MFAREQRIRHDLAPHYDALRAIRRRRTLLRSPLYAEIGAEIERVLGAVARGERDDLDAHTGGRLRAVAWNIQRGRELEAVRRALAEDPTLATADVVLLSEVDCGMGRSGNRDVARELAAALGMSYVFVVSYLVLEDDFGENPDRQASTTALAGLALLTRRPLGRVENVDLPELRDKFSSREKRLGKKRALVAELLLDDGPLAIGLCHLDSVASPAQRAAQLGMVLERLEALGHPRMLLGGDFNTSTYDLASPWALAWNIIHKLVINGFAGSIAHYMHPDRWYERPIFAELAQHDFTVDGFNDRAHGTLVYDLSDSYMIEKARSNVGAFLTWILRRKLRPWNGLVPVRLDWFAGKGVEPRAAAVVKVRGEGGQRASDHSAVVVDISL